MCLIKYIKEYKWNYNVMNYSCDVLEKLCMYNIYVRDDLNLIAYPSV